MYRFRALPAWFAILGVAWHALWPLLAQAQPRDPLRDAPICSVAGTVHKGALPAAPSPLGPDATGAHCALCLPGGGTPALVPANAALSFAPPASAPRMAAACAIVAVPLLHPSAGPRAPPVKS